MKEETISISGLNLSQRQPALSAETNADGADSIPGRSLQ